MRKIYSLTLTLMLFCFFQKGQVLASRAFAPLKLSPVIYNDIKITAPNSTPDDMGIVQAFNTKTNALLWSKKIYKVRIKPNIEEDTQLVFIKKLKIENDKLIIVNERQEKYVVDPYTGKVLNGSKSYYIAVTLMITTIICSIVIYYLYRSRKSQADQ